MIRQVKPTGFLYLPSILISGFYWLSCLICNMRTLLLRAVSVITISFMLIFFTCGGYITLIVLRLHVISSFLDVTTAIRSCVNSIAISAFFSITISVSSSLRITINVTITSTISAFWLFSYRLGGDDCFRFRIMTRAIDGLFGQQVVTGGH